MNFTSCRRLVSLLVYCGVSVLVIVNGQSTTDDDIDKDESIRHTVEALRVEFRAEQEELKMELERVKGELAAMSATKSQESTCQLNTVTLSVCLINGDSSFVIISDFYLVFRKVKELGM